MSCPETIYIDLHVTQAVINRGQKSSSEYCPIATGVAEALRTKGYQDILPEVEDGAFRVYVEGCEYKAKVKNHDGQFLDSFIEKFDGKEGEEGKVVMPFSILNIPLELIEPEPDEFDYE